ELNRVLSVVKAVRSMLSVPISVDTTRAAVAQKAVEAGADMVNDISGGTFDPDILSVVAQLNVPIALMHIRGTPQTMQQLTEYQDLIGEIYEFLERQIAAAISDGIERSHLIVDPGIGFANTYVNYLEFLRQLLTLRSL